jgi:hypothetical protein
MAVIINELEIVLEPSQAPPQPGGKTPAPEKPPVSPHDIMTLMDREQRVRLRTLAH